MKEEVVTLNASGKIAGTMDKMEAHRQGVLHKAFSVFIFNENREWLLQKRAKSKYHSGGLWTNACCGHPRPGERSSDAAERRLYEEMGLKCKLDFAFEFKYKVHFENGLTENELDKVYIGFTNDMPVPDPSECEDWKFLDADTLKKDVKVKPEAYTKWFLLCRERAEQAIRQL